jgi:hypothetical protein
MPRLGQHLFWLWRECSEALQHVLDLSIALLDLPLVEVVQFEGLLQREDVLGSSLCENALIA